MKIHEFHWQCLEEPWLRFGLPFIPEYDAWFVRALWAPELRSALAGSHDHSLRGRLRRILGDSAGAAKELRTALDRDPDDARAHAWLAEIDLRRPQAWSGLDRALSIDPSLPEALLYRGASLLLRALPAEAARDLERLVECRPEAALGHILLGRAYERLKHPAAGPYRKAARIHPACAAAHLLASRAEKDPERSARCCETALDADPTYALITLSWHKPSASWRGHLARMRDFAFKEPARAGWYYRQQDIHYSPYQFKEYSDSQRLLDARPGPWARALVARALLRCPPSAARAAQGVALASRACRDVPWAGWLRAWKGLALVKQGRAPSAAVHFDASVKLQPFYHRAYAWRGALRRKLGFTARALQDLDRAVSVDEQYPFAAHERSLARRALGDWAGAARDLDRAFSMDLRYRWVFTAGREARPQELAAGLKEIDAAVTRQPALASLRAWRGELLSSKMMRSEALRELRAAVHLDPHHALAHAFLGRVLLEQGRAQEAAEALNRACALAPESPVFEGWRAQAESRAGRAARAFRRLSALIGRLPDPHWALFLRAELRLENDQPRRALSDVLKATAVEGRHADGYFLEARARLAQGDVGGAQTAVDKVLELSPHLGRAYLLRAEIRQRRGQGSQALEDYRQVLGRFPYLFNPEERRRVAELVG